MNALINAAWTAECDEPSDKLVLVYLADRANAVSRAWPHMKAMVRDTGFSRRTISASLYRLEAREHLTVSRRQGCSNSYTVHPKSRPQTGAMVAPVKIEPVQPLPATGATIAHEPVQPLHQQPNHNGISMKRITDATGKTGIGTSSPALSAHRPSEQRERELMVRLRILLGDDEMRCAGGHWRVNWVRKHPDLVESALADLDCQIKENKPIHNRAAWLVDWLKRFKPKPKLISGI